MKRITTFALTLILSLGFAVSAQAVTIDLSDGTTANTVFGAVSGIKFVDDQAEIASIITSNASTYYDLYLLGSDSQYTNSLGSGAYRTFQKFNYGGGFDPDNGLYTENNKIKENVLLSDVSFEIMASGTLRYVFNLGSVLANYADRPLESLYDTNYYGSVSQGAMYSVWPKLQMYIVTDYSVEINGNTFYQGSIIFALDDSDHTHIDFNDLVFVMGGQTPPPVVPIPGAAFLLAPGLAGIAVLRKKLA